MTSPAPQTRLQKLKVLFVGAFEAPLGSQIRGGQLAACRAILDSPLSDHIEWVLLDSTMESIPPPSVQRRAWRALLRLTRFIGHLCTTKFDCALIFTSNELSLVEKGWMTMLARLAGKRVVLCPRSGFLTREYRLKRFTRTWLRLILRCSDCVVCQGKGWKEFFSAISGLPAERFKIIYNIVNNNLYGQIPLPLQETAQRALLMGWIEENKGIFDLVEVVDRFRPELIGMQFIICGRGQGWDRLAAEIDTRKLHKFFDLRGWADEDQKLAALAEADLCLMLSHFEGMPNALIEAMAAGRPVVATAVGAVPDIVEEGRNGFLCEPRDIDEIGFRILDLRRDRGLRVRMGEEARNTVRQRLNAGVVWHQWHQALERPGKSSATN